MVSQTQGKTKLIFLAVIVLAVAYGGGLLHDWRDMDGKPSTEDRINQGRKTPSPSAKPPFVRVTILFDKAKTGNVRATFTGLPGLNELELRNGYNADHPAVRGTEVSVLVTREDRSFDGRIYCLLEQVDQPGHRDEDEKFTSKSVAFCAIRVT